MTSKLQQIYNDIGMVKFFQKDISIESYKKLAAYFTGQKKISDITVIETSSQLDISNPYASREELDLHTESIGEAQKRVVAIFLTMLQKPQIGGESTFVYTPSVIEKLPVDFGDIEYTFRYLDMDYTEKLIVKHPFLDMYTLNFTTFGIDRKKGTSKYIHNFGSDSRKSQEKLMYLYDVISSLKFSVILENSQSVLFDNFLYLHGRAEYKGNRIVQRCEVYI